MSRPLTPLLLALGIALTLLLTGCPTVPPPDTTGNDDGTDPTAFTLTVHPIGNGTITSEPEAIHCPSTCNATIEADTILTLHATPDQGHTFTGWTGDHDCNDGTITLNRDTTCAALFPDANTPSHPLEVEILGQGSVTSSPSGIDCPTSDCTALYPHDTVVTLTATPSDGHTFNGWHGDADCSDGQVTLTDAATCIAAFNSTGTPSHVLTVSVNRGGSVTSHPTSIDCPTGDCHTQFDEGTIVTLHATPDTGYTFDNWSGDSDCSDGQVTMTNDRACTATFEPQRGFTTVSANGYHSLAIDQDGNAWGWGYNFFGQVGDATFDNERLVPTAVRIPRGVTFTTISTGGGHSLALDQNGNAWGWGHDGSGQIGNDTRPNNILAAPTRVQMPDGVTFTTISAGDRHSLAIDQDGNAWGWGWNWYGQVGDTTSKNVRLVPTAVQMPRGVSFTTISAGLYHSLAIDQNGNAWGWGHDGNGQVGNDTIPNNVLAAPTRVQMPDDVRFTNLSAGGFHTVALDQAGTAWAWGANDFGQVGDTTYENQRLVPTAVAMPAGVTFTAISAGSWHCVALDQNDHAWGWGHDNYGQVGNDPTLNEILAAPTRVQMPDGVTFTAVDSRFGHAIAIDQNGNGWGWGLNQFGQIGDDSDLNYRAVPVAVTMPSP